MTTKPPFKATILELLKGENKQHAEAFGSYCLKLLTDVTKQNEIKNMWMQTKTPEILVTYFKKVKSEGLVFDGKHVTLQSTGISYDYQAYKNKMLLVYPESKMDMDVVKTGDTFNVDKVDGDITYRHVIAKPLETATYENIEGAYCVIKNARGNFITILSKEDLAKHRRVARTDSIWKDWYKEMVMKTVIKKGCKYHFDDVFESMVEEDNTQNELLEIDEEDDTKFENEKKRIIDVIKTKTTVAELKSYYSSLTTEFSKDGDIIEECKAQKVICQANTK